MIFRSEYWSEEKISRTVEHDHRHISRIIGHCWNQLPEEEKDKWRQKAEQEKLDHMRKYPGYRFSPNARTKKVVRRKVKRNGEEELLRCKQLADLLLAGKHGADLDTALKNMKTPAHDTALNEIKQGRDSARQFDTSPTADELHNRGENSTEQNSSPSLPALGSVDVPIFRSPLLPPAEVLGTFFPLHLPHGVSLVFYNH
jgi:hypothetical protein